MRVITLPYPDSRLNPNKSNGRHWGSTKAIKDDAKLIATRCAQIVYASITVESKPTPLKITFVKPTRARFDLDNAYASCKYYLDGIALGMGIDDQYFYPITLDKRYEKGQSYITVEISDGVRE